MASSKEPKPDKASAKEPKAEKRQPKAEKTVEALPTSEGKPSKNLAGPARLREHYLKEVVPSLTKEFGYDNIMAVPKIQKISINIGLGEATQNPRN